MNYSLKIGASVDMLDPKLKDLLDRLALLWQAFFPEDPDGLTITSGSEGTVANKVHMVTSLHYPENSPSGLGRAIDIRVRDVSMSNVRFCWTPCCEKFLEMISEHRQDFDIVWEGDHIHIEYQPKKSFNIV